MGLFSVFQRKAKARSVSFSSYRNPRASYRKPIETKKYRAEPDRRRQRLLEKRPNFLGLLKLFLGVVGTGLLIYGLFFTSLFEIQKIDIVGASDTLEEQAALSTYFQDSLGENLLMFSPAEHEEILLKDYSYLKTLKIRRVLLHTVQVTLETYPPVARVRVDKEDGSQDYFIVNELGIITGSGTGLEDLPLIVMDVTGTDLKLDADANSETEVSFVVNQVLISKETLEILLDTTDSFEAKFNLQVLEINYLKRARELHLKTERDFTVWIDLTQDVPLQLAKLKKSLAELNIYEAPLEYIDLRISGQNGEKVIYKLR